MTRRSLRVIRNPTAGRRRRRLGRVLDALARDGIKLELAPTAHAGHAVELSRNGHGFDSVVAAGGDGTVNEVIVAKGCYPAAIAAGRASAWTDMRMATARERWLDTPAGA